MAFADNHELVSYLAKKLGGTHLSITSEWQNTEGWSMETFSLGVKYTKDGKTVDQEIIMRRQPVSGLLEPYDVSTEYRIVDALQTSAVIVPETFWFESDPAVFERPFYTMAKVAGDVHFVNQNPDPDYRLIADDEERASLATDFICNLAHIHNSDWQQLGLGFLGDPGSGKNSALAQVKYWSDVIERAGIRSKPLLTLAINWLVNNAPETEQVRLVHGDYRTGNFIYKDSRITSILDWEMTHLGDPHEDIVYVLGALWRSAQPTNWVCHLLPEDEFLSRYEQQSGIEVESDKLKYFQVLLDLKGIGIMATAANSFAQGKTADLKPPAFGSILDLAYAGLAQHLNQSLLSC